MRAAWGLLVLVACDAGQVTLDDDSDGTADPTDDADDNDRDDDDDDDDDDNDDGEEDDDVPPLDTGTPLPDPPALSVSWATPTPLVELNSDADDVDGTMTRDLLRICFASTREGGGGGGLDLWCAERASTADPFEAPVPQTALASPQSDAQPSLGWDGEELLFTSDRTGTSELYRATWQAATRTYGAPTLVSSLDSTAADEQASLSAVGRAVVFVSQRGEEEAVYWATRDELGGDWGAATVIDQVSDAGPAQDPALSMDAAALVFSSLRPLPGFTTAFVRQLWAADGGAGAFTAPYPLVFEDFERPLMTGPCPLADGTLLFSASHNVGASVGPQDLYVAARKAGVVDTRGLLPRTFDVEGERARHGVGRSSAEGWSADPDLDAEGHMMFGPYTREIPAGDRVVTFHLKVPSLSDVPDRVVNLDVYTPGQKLDELRVDWNDFTSTATQAFELPFTAQEGQVLEFRVYFADVAPVTVVSITVR